MRDIDSRATNDWFASGLRWFALVCLSLPLLWQGEGNIALATIFLAAAAWNLALSILSFNRRRIRAHEILSVAVDLLIANLLFFFSGALQGPLGWAGLLPVFTAGLFFGIRGILLSALISVLSLGIQAIFFSPMLSVLRFSAVALIGNLVLGFLFYWLSHSMLSGFGKKQLERLKSMQDAEKAESDHLRRIFDFLAGLYSNLNYPEVLDATLNLCTRALSATEARTDLITGFVLVFSNSVSGDRHLKVGSARRSDPGDMNLELRGTEGLIARTLEEGQPRLEKNIPKDPELSCFASLKTCQVACCAPLKVGASILGVLLFAHPDVKFFTPQRREILEIAGNQAAIAIQNARKYQELGFEKERILEGQEETRRRLAQELHDGPTQSVAALAMRVNFSRRLFERDSKAALEELYKVEDLARRTTTAMRQILFSLRLLELGPEGLAASLGLMADFMRKTFNRNVIVDLEQEIISRLDQRKQAILFFIAEEAVNEASKRGQVEHIWVRVKSEGDDLAMLEIEDDARATIPDDVSGEAGSLNGLGVANMREHSALVNGIFKVQPLDERGMRIQLVIPLTDEAAKRLHERA